MAMGPRPSQARSPPVCTGPRWPRINRPEKRRIGLISRILSCATLVVRPERERGGPISPIGFHRLIQRLGEAAKMPFPIHPHMLRHACGFKLANDGHDTRALQHYLGHKNIQHTVRYTELSPYRFRDLWLRQAGSKALLPQPTSSLPALHRRNQCLASTQSKPAPNLTSHTNCRLSRWPPASLPPNT